MKFILLNGCSCSGKSTIVKELLQRRERLFNLSYDSLKWSFSQYTPDKCSSYVQAIMLAVLGAVAELKYDVICDSGLFRERRQELIDFAVAHNYKIIEINLEADFEELSRRFDTRVASALADPKSRISNISKERFKELFDIFQKEKNTAAIIIRTDTQSSKDVIEEVLKIF